MIGDGDQDCRSSLRFASSRDILGSASKIKLSRSKKTNGLKALGDELKRTISPDQTFEGITLYMIVRGTNARISAASIALLSSVAFPSLCFAQTLPIQTAAAQQTAPSADVEDSSGDIIVTAQKRSQSTQKIGISIAAFGDEQLRSLGVKDIKDVVTLVPGFTVANSSRGPAIYTLRGVGFNTPNASTSSPVGLYMDEIAYPYPVMTEGTAFDLERVEVLKGPQGTLYGRNTTGGLVNSIANKPTQQTEGYAQVSYGSYQSYGLQAALSGGLTPTLAARLAVSIDRSERGWQQNIITGDRLGKVDKFGARLSLAWEPSSSAKFLLTGNWVRDNSETQTGQSISIYAKGIVLFGADPLRSTPASLGLGIPPALFDQAFKPTNAKQTNWAVNQPAWGTAPGEPGGHNFTPGPEGQPLQKHNELLAVALRGNIEVSNNVTLTSLTSYTDFSRNELNDVEGIALEGGLSNELGYIRSFSQELRLAGETNNFNWIAGAFYAHDKTAEIDRNWGAFVSDIIPLRTLGLAFAPATTSLAERQDIQWGFRDWRNQNFQSITTKALFGQVEWKFAPQLKLTLGGRYTKDKDNFSGCSRDNGDNSIAATWNGAFKYVLGINSAVPPGGCVTYLGPLTAGMGASAPAQGLVKKTLDQSNFSGRAGLDWQANPDLLIYGYYARGFKSGAFPNPSASVESQYNPATQEQLDAFEVGFKSKPVNGVTLNAAGFYYNYKNKQVYGYVTDIVFGTLNRIVNVPKSEIYGAELELTIPLFTGLTFRGSASYLHTKIKEYVGFDDFGISHNFAGSNFTYSPSFQSSMILNYRTSLSDTWDMRTTLNGRYTSASYGDLLHNSLFRVDPYAIFDANITLVKDEKYEVAFYAKNLTNKYYWTAAQLYEDSLARYAGRPRTWGVSLRTSF